MIFFYLFSYLEHLRLSRDDTMRYLYIRNSHFLQTIPLLQTISIIFIALCVK